MGPGCAVFAKRAARCRHNTIKRGHARPCRNPALSFGALRKYCESGRLTGPEVGYLLTTAEHRGHQVCAQHLCDVLEDRFPDIKKRFWPAEHRNRWRRNVAPMRMMLGKMRRMGLIAKRPGVPRPPDHLRCTARCIGSQRPWRSGKRCWNYRIEGARTCRHHGGSSPAARKAKRLAGTLQRSTAAIRARQRAASFAEHERRRLLREARAARGDLAPGIGFKLEKPQPRSLYDEFTAHRVRRPRDRGPGYES
jgi:hypothetical protein